MCRRGMAKPQALMAHLTRERASRTAESGIPTTVTPGIPPATLASTFIGTDSIPLIVAVLTQTTFELDIFIPAKSANEMSETCVVFSNKIDGDHIETDHTHLSMKRKVEQSHLSIHSLFLRGNG